MIDTATTVAAGTLVLAGQPIAEHCRVTGRTNVRTSAVDGKSYAIGFEMRLPKAWNGRFWHQGNGGIDGSVVTATGNSGGGGPLTSALLQGFAVLSSNAGHDNAAVGGPAFGLDPQARLDYGYQAVGTMTPIAKAWGVVRSRIQGSNAQVAVQLAPTAANLPRRLRIWLSIVRSST